MSRRATRILLSLVAAYWTSRFSSSLSSKSAICSTRLFILSIRGWVRTHLHTSFRKSILSLSKCSPSVRAPIQASTFFVLSLFFFEHLWKFTLGRLSGSPCSNPCSSLYSITSFKAFRRSSMLAISAPSPKSYSTELFG